MDDRLYFLFGYIVGVVSFTAMIAASWWSAKRPVKRSSPRRRTTVSPQEPYKPGPRRRATVNTDEAVWDRQQGR